MPKVDFSKLGKKEEGKEVKEAKANPFTKTEKAESNPFTKAKPEEIRENVIEVETDEPKELCLAVSKTAYSIIDVEKERPLTMQERKQKIKQTMELVEYAAKHALREDDFWLPPQSRGKKSLTRSGCNKLAAVFNITCETLNIVEVKKEPKINGEEDIVAYATVKATRPNGSYVIITALKALSEYESSKEGARDPKDWVSMQFLKGTAETRAMNRAIINAIGFVPKDYITVSKEEFDISN
jgi:tRNA threonylcarbamoyladenosine modification (KEOPS) complex Cgi121 subunit